MIGVHNRVDPHGFVYNAAAASYPTILAVWPWRPPPPSWALAAKPMHALRYWIFTQSVPPARVIHNPTSKVEGSTVNP